MKKAFVSLLFTLFLAVIAAGALTAPARAASQEVSARTLGTLGLMNGVGTNADGSADYALSGGADRQTATTMLVRLLGKEQTALKGSWRMPFSDFSAWAKPYVGYAYSTGLVNGIGARSFGGTGAITAQQYITMLLRALGYSDASGEDFTYAGACAFADNIGLSDGSYTNATASFTRGDIAVLSLNALKAARNGSSKTLYTYTTGKAASAVTDAEAAAEKAVSVSSATISRSSDGSVAIDYGEASKGIVKISANIAGSPKLAVIVTSPAGTQYKYFYTDTKGAWQSFVLSEGSGSYKAAVYKNTSGTSYVTLHAASFKADIEQDTAPFLRSNLYVDYTASTQCVKAAQTLCKGLTNDLDKVDAVYYYVVNNFTYDYDLAETVQSGYRPVLDTVWAVKKGICFDYASTMTAMLRSQGVATKLVVGYAGTVYHAWINVYTPETGWVEAIIYFDGQTWKLMDPTFASTGKASKEIMAYINDPANYKAKYVY